MSTRIIYSVNGNFNSYQFVCDCCGAAEDTTQAATDSGTIPAGWGKHFGRQQISGGWGWLMQTYCPTCIEAGRVKVTCAIAREGVRNDAWG